MTNPPNEVVIDVDALYTKYDELVGKTTPTEALQQALCDSIEEG